MPGLVRIDAGAPVDPMVARGEYLVRHVGGCMDCHTPRLLSGRFDESRLLSGIEELFDVEPDDPARGLLHSRNLTPDEKTGLGRFSDAQIKKAFQQGIDDESTVLHWMMPYWIFRNMSDADADAIVAFLRSIPAVVHSVPDNQPNAVDISKPYEPYTLPLDQVPDSVLGEDDPNRESAQRGRYIATALSPCLLCHTPEQTSDGAIPIDLARAYSGRRKFIPAPLGVDDRRGARAGAADREPEPDSARQRPRRMERAADRERADGGHGQESAGLRSDAVSHRGRQLPRDDSQRCARRRAVPQEHRAQRQRRNPSLLQRLPHRRQRGRRMGIGDGPKLSSFGCTALGAAALPKVR